MASSGRQERLALYGGPRIKQTPFGTGRRYGERELEELRDALEQNTLFYAHGRKTRQFEEAFARLYGIEHCVATSSGSAALHIAIGALEIGVGEEVITSPITDMGSLIGILLQNAIPIFADVHPHTYNITAETIEPRITEKTRAIMVVHLAGNPCDMDPILDLARRYSLWVIEDCAQAYLARYKGRLAGTMGHVGCFSLNDFKHISAGDAGLLITHDSALARKARLFSDKYYDREAGGRNPERLGMNYRISELQSAVALAQLERLPWICERRKQIGEAITAGILDIPGVYPHQVTSGSECSFWFYLFRVNEEEAGVHARTFAEALRAEGIPAHYGYIGKPVYLWPFLRERRIYYNFNWPEDFKQYGKPLRYEEGLCPVAEEVLRTCIQIPLSEFYTDGDVADIVAAIQKVAEAFAP
ncbi:MAG: DegT/DnrJ/EryC1/StrS family aminotransferase [candidate division KSB1 bacterium]|nr:DegT/DnrJ/EryC1/StrS family aminotransferase [candidate division KSB1 bacterium]